MIMLAGSSAVIILGTLGQRLSASSRSLETVALFALFVFACLAIDRFLTLHLKHLGNPANELREVKRLGSLRIGVPEGLVHLEALRQQHRLEHRLNLLGVDVKWVEYTSASALLQSLNNNEIDFCGGGGTPSVFAQAADLLFMRVARDKYTNTGGEAILVPNDSEITSLEELRGCRIAVEEGSTAHYVLARALMHAGISPSELEIIFLSRIDALPQFTSGFVDAWSVWVPYADSPRRKEFPGRSIASLQNLFGNEPSLKLPTLYYSTPELAKNFPRILKLILEEINEAGAQVNRDNVNAIERLRDQLPVSSEWIENLRNLAEERSIVPLDSRALEGLQQQADILRELKLIPKRVRVYDGTYSLMMRQNWTF
jgi:sulfonate transport system substrate-binding protein